MNPDRRLRVIAAVRALQIMSKTLGEAGKAINTRVSRGKDSNAGHRPLAPHRVS